MESDKIEGGAVSEPFGRVVWEEAEAEPTLGLNPVEMKVPGMLYFPSDSISKRRSSSAGAMVELESRGREEAVRSSSSPRPQDRLGCVRDSLMPEVEAFDGVR